MTDKPFWSRIKDARLFQVIVIYLAASWLVLQVVGLFIDTVQRGEYAREAMTPQL